MNLKIHATRMPEMPDVSSRGQIAGYTTTVGDPAPTDGAHLAVTSL